MASLRDIRRRIGSVKNTRQITSAMKLVSGAKLRKATDAATAAKPYKQTLGRVITRVVQGAENIEHPLLQLPNNDTDVVVVLITSDRGLCGGFNNSLCKATMEKVKGLQAEGKNVRLRCYGKKGRAFFTSRGFNISKAVIDINIANYGELAIELASELVDEMAEHKFQTVYLAYNEFKSVMSQPPGFEQLLPMKVVADEPAAQVQGGAMINYIYEPKGDEILDGLLPMALQTRILQGFLETQAGEQAARMTAMDNATRNASELIDALTLQYNRARQAAITKELIEIVSGAEAL